jgi:DNA primase
MLFDMDAAGQQAAQKSADLCLQKGVTVKIVTLTDGKDAADVVAKDPELLLNAVRKSVLAMEYFFAEALKKYDKKTADGKQHIAKEVLAHVSHIESHIEKAHWIKKIAHEVDVEEKVISDVLKTVTANMEKYEPVKISLPDQSSSFQKRSDIIRDSLVGLILSNAKVWKETFENEIGNELFVNDSLVQFVLQSGSKVNFSFDGLLADIEDANAAAHLRKICFNAKYLFTQEGVVEYSDDELRALVISYIAQYAKELQKERLHDTIKQIEIAEQKGDKETLAKLMREFTRLSQEMQ